MGFLSEPSTGDEADTPFHDPHGLHLRIERTPVERRCWTCIINAKSHRLRHDESTTD